MTQETCDRSRENRGYAKELLIVSQTFETFTACLGYMGADGAL